METKTIKLELMTDEKDELRKMLTEGLRSRNRKPTRSEFCECRRGLRLYTSITTNPSQEIGWCFGCGGFYINLTENLGAEDYQERVV